MPFNQAKPLAVWYLRAFNSKVAAQLKQTKQYVLMYAAANRLEPQEALSELIEYAYKEYERRTTTPQV